MSDGPRQRRANAWAWLYLALFEAAAEPPGTERESDTEDGSSGER